MTIASLDYQKAIIKVWNDSGLNDLFKSYWINPSIGGFSVLNDQEAGPAQPMPYCVFSSEEGTKEFGMSGSSNDTNRMEIRDIPLTFKIHARSKGTKSAKQIAGELAEQVIRIFGGHPSEKPVLPTLEHGVCLKSNYKTDYCVREGDHEYEWNIKYTHTCDVPVAS